MSLLESLKQDLLRAMEMLGAYRRMTNRDKIYNAAYASIGMDASPQDLAPDEYGCAETLSDVIRKALPELNFPVLLSTRELYRYLQASPSWCTVEVPTPGCLILSVTGTGNGHVENGHCGVVGKQWIMSNDSRTGTWEANYQIDAWRRHYEFKGGMSTHFFDCA